MKLKIYFMICLFALTTVVHAQSIQNRESRDSITQENTPDNLVTYDSAVKGHVFESDGVTPISGIPVRIYNTSWQQAGWDQTDGEGRFFVGNLQAGDYYAHADGTTEKGNVYFEEYFDNATSQGLATQIAVADSDTTANINFTLDRKGAISGRVCQSDGITPIANTMVDVYNTSWEPVTGAFTDGNGYYTVYGLLTGYYYLKATGYIIGEGEFYIEEYYNNSPTKSGATSLSVSPPNTVGGIDFALTRGYHVWPQVVQGVGHVTVNPQKLVYAPGDEVELYAYPAELYPQFVFDHWGGDIEGTGNPRSVVCEGDDYQIDVEVYFRETTGPQCNLNTTANPYEAGTIVRDPEQVQYDSASVVGLTAVPEDGWVFKDWMGDLNSSENPTSVVMNFDKYISGNFGHSLEIMITPEGSGTVTLSPEKDVYIHEEGVQLTAVPQEGYRFKRWDGNIDGEDNPAYLTMNQNKHIYAVFEEIQEVTLTMQVNPEGVGETSPEVGVHSYEQGEVVQVIAYAPEGYQFTGWGGPVADLQNDTTTVTMNTNKTLTAFFAEIGFNDVILTMNVYPEGSGETSPAVGNHTYETYEVVEIAAEPAEGYRFLYWEGYYITQPCSAHTTVTVDMSKTVTAKFEAIGTGGVTLTMKVYPEGSGETVPAVGNHTYDLNQVVEIAAEAVEGYRFKYWEGAVAQPCSTHTTVTMNENKTVWAKFEYIGTGDPVLTMKVYPEGSGETVPAVGNHTYDLNQVVEIAAEAVEGYRFKYWEGSVAQPCSTHTTVTMNENKTVWAKFEYIGTGDPVLTMKVYPEGSGETVPAVGNHTYDLNQVVEIAAEAVEGYRFKYWEGSVAQPCSTHTTVTMNESRTVWAKFEAVVNEEVTLTMTVSPDSVGETNPEKGTHTYSQGEVVQLIAYAPEGYEFAGWEGPVADWQNDTTTVTMHQDKTITAFFETANSGEVSLTMKVVPEESGYTYPEIGSHTYTLGETVEIAAEPEEGFLFSHWTGGVADSAAMETTVILDEDRTVIAHFTETDIKPPELRHCYPAPGSQMVPANTRIQFTIFDRGSGVDKARLNTWVDGLLIIENGEDQTGGKVKMNNSCQNHTIKYHPAEPFDADATIAVRIQIPDLAEPSNLCDSTYIFTTCAAIIDTGQATTVGQEGGVVTDPETGIEMEIPAEALEDTVSITISEVEDAPPLPEGLEGIATSAHFGPDGLQFQIPISVRIPFTQADLDSAGITDPADFHIFYFHTSTGSWIELTIDHVNLDEMYVWVKVEQFCYLTLGQSTQSAVDDPLQPQTSPDQFQLSQNYPNPFNPETQISYFIPRSCHVTLSVFNTNGRMIQQLVNGQIQAGHHRVVWNAMNSSGNKVTSGLYLVIMKAGDYNAIRKMSLLK